MTDIALATAADRDAVVATVVAAFAEDPALRWFLPDGAYEAGAHAMFGRLFDARVAHGTVWLAEGAAAVAMWDPPVEVEHAPQTGRFERYQSIVHSKLPKTPHWYLGVLATDPQHRGRRLGRAVLRPGLERAAADGLPAYLETSNSHNVEVYRSAGFEVADHVMVDDLPVWIMRSAPSQ